MLQVTCHLLIVIIGALLVQSVSSALGQNSPRQTDIFKTDARILDLPPGSEVKCTVNVWDTTTLDSHAPHRVEGMKRE